MSVSGLHVKISKAHKWVSLLLVVQLLFWTLGGVVMSWIPIEMVRSEHRVAQQPPINMQQFGQTLSPSKIAAQQDIKFYTEARYKMLLNTPVVQLKSNAEWQIFNALNGKPFAPIDQDTAMKIAAQDLIGNPMPLEAIWMTAPNTEYRGPRPVWQVQFRDDVNTTLYVSPNTGRVISRRTDIWRIYDFLWMLHIMDYDERHDFNNPLLMATSLSALLFVCTGVMMIGYRFRKRDFERSKTRR